MQTDLGFPPPHPTPKYMVTIGPVKTYRFSSTELVEAQFRTQETSIFPALYLARILFRAPEDTF